MRHVRFKFQQGGIRTVAVGRLRVMSGDHMIGEQAKPLQVAASGEELERAVHIRSQAQETQHCIGSTEYFDRR
jgi:hypothetical protein